jgi:hypothetical protein
MEVSNLFDFSMYRPTVCVIIQHNQASIARAITTTTARKLLEWQEE